MSDKTVAVTHITPPDPVRYRIGSSLRESARQAALEMIRRSDEALAAMDAEDNASRPHDTNCHADERAHWDDCECWCHDEKGAR